MKVISTNHELRRQLIRLIRRHDNIAIATAWASSNTEVFAELMTHRDKIQQGVIGTHFYQTDPGVLDEFVGSETVKFRLQTNGVFHPKTYVFWSDGGDWAAIVGSPNLTAGALKCNSELSLLISSDGQAQETTFAELLRVIDSYAKQARTIDQADAIRYRRLWEVRSKHLKQLADDFGTPGSTRSAAQCDLLAMDWPTYLRALEKDHTHGFKERVAMITRVREMLTSESRFQELDLEDRKAASGLRSQSVPNAEWFGSMTGAGRFASLIIGNSAAISEALEEIPDNGEVREEHYNSFIGLYKSAFKSGGHGLGTATRLLSMKRPDVFLCVNDKNRSALSSEIGIAKYRISYKTYWTEVIQRLMSSPWWQSPRPKTTDEQEPWDARMAMLDAILYEDSSPTNHSAPKPARTQ